MICNLLVISPQEVLKVTLFIKEENGPLTIHYEESIDAFLTAVMLMRTFIEINRPSICRPFKGKARGLVISEVLPPTISGDSLYLTTEDSDDENVITVGDLILSIYSICKSLNKDSRGIVLYPLIASYLTDDGLNRLYSSDSEEIQSLVEESSGEIVRDQQFVFPSQMVLPLNQVLEFSLNPPIIPLLGQPQEIEKFLYKAGIQSGILGTDLDYSSRTTLNSQLVMLTASENKKLNLPKQYMDNVLKITNSHSRVVFVHFYTELLIRFFHTERRNLLLRVLLGENGIPLQTLLKEYKDGITSILDLCLQQEISYEDTSGLCTVTIPGIKSSYIASRVLYCYKLKGKLPTNSIASLMFGEDSAVFIEGQNPIVGLNVISDSIFAEKKVKVHAEIGGALVATFVDKKLLMTIREFIEMNFL